MQKRRKELSYHCIRLLRMLVLAAVGITGCARPWYENYGTDRTSAAVERATARPSDVASEESRSERAVSVRKIPAALHGAADVGSLSTPPVRAPDSRPLPSWAAALPLFEWYEIPGTELQRSDAWTGYPGSKGGSKRGILAFSGGAIKARGSELFIAGGGHTDYSGNEIFSIVLGSERPKWTRRINPSVAPPLPDRNVAYYDDGRPASRHTYWTLQFIEQRNLLFFFGAPALWARVGRTEDVLDAFDPSTNDYLPAGRLPGYPGIANYATGIAKDAEGNVYVHILRTGELVRWNQSSNTWTSFGMRGKYQYETPYAIDTRRGHMFRLSNGKVPAAYFDLAHGAAKVDVIVKGQAADQAGGSGQLVYDSGADVFWFWKRGDSRLYRIHPETWEATVQPTSGVEPNNARVTSIHNTYGRFNYAPELSGLVFMRDEATNVYFIRTSR